MLMPFSFFFFLVTDNHRRGMYLQITLDGRVSGSDVQTPYSKYSVNKSLADSTCGSKLAHLSQNSLDNLRPRKIRPKEDYLCFCVSRCAGAKISQTRPYSHHGEVIISVSLCGQQRQFKGTGTISKERFHTLKSLSVFLFTDSLCLLSLLEALHRGWLHLQRTAAGGWIHPFPFLTPWISCVYGIETFPRSTCSPLHQISTN